LGLGSVVICNSGRLTIGRNSVIGANAVVTRSVPAFSVVAGNPARIIRQIESSSPFPPVKDAESTRLEIV